MRYRQRYDARISALVRQLDDRDAHRRRRSREQLRALGRQATPWLVALLASRRRRRRRDAAWILAGIADPASVPALVAALKDDDEDVQALASDALVGIGRPALIAVLVFLGEQVDDPVARDGARRVLRVWRNRHTGKEVAPLYRELSRAADASDVLGAAERAIRNLE